MQVEFIKQATVVSNEFTVFGSRGFPGMLESTPLSRFFAEQGIKVRIRKDSRVNR